MADNQEGRQSVSAIHDISGELGATVRIIPYADEQAIAYLASRHEDDAQARYVLREDDTRERRKALHAKIVATIEALARKVQCEALEAAMRTNRR